MPKTAALAALCILAASPSLADLVDAGALPHRRTCTETLTLNQGGSLVAACLSNVYKPSNPRSAIEPTRHRFVLPNVTLRENDRISFLAFNANSSPWRFAPSQPDLQRAWRTESALTANIDSPVFRLPRRYSETPETATGMLVGSSLVLIGILIEKKLQRRVRR